MIDWNAPDWGNHVTLAANGSWVTDRHESRIGCPHVAWTAEVAGATDRGTSREWRRGEVDAVGRVA